MIFTVHALLPFFRTRFQLFVSKSSFRTICVPSGSVSRTIWCVPLCLPSWAKNARAGFASWLDAPEEESYVIHKKSGKKIGLKWVNGVYKMQAWVRNPGFTRPGR